MNESILQALNWRYAAKTFDKTKTVSDEDIATILESARLAPSVLGIEPWKFIMVKNPELRTKLRAAAYDQSKVDEASHLVIIAHRTDAEVLSAELIDRTVVTTGASSADLAPYKDMIDGTVAAHSTSPDMMNGWLAGQTYIPLGIMIETAALLGVDAGPMEGFDAEQIDEILGLKAKNLHVVSMIAFGYRGEDAYATMPKVRRAYDEVIEVL